MSCRHRSLVYPGKCALRPLAFVNNPAALWPLGHHPTGKKQHQSFQASSVLCSSGLINEHMPSTHPDAITDREPTAGFILPLSPARAASFPEKQPIFMVPVQ